jgi:hypothetical protein
MHPFNALAGGLIGIVAALLSAYPVYLAVATYQKVDLPPRRK